MPIPIAKLEDAQRSIEEQILGFLRSHAQEAFTLEEIYSEINEVSVDMVSLLHLLADRPSAVLELWGKDLQKLVQSGKVRSAVVGGQSYYGIGALG